MSSVRAIRGAITTSADHPDAIGEAVQELLVTMLERNSVDLENVISVIFTATTDLVSAFPATAARSVGFGAVPLICASEIAVPGSMPRCIRVMMHVESHADRDSIRHIYLRDAVSLRDDIAQ